MKGKLGNNFTVLPRLSCKITCWPLLSSFWGKVLNISNLTAVFTISVTERPSCTMVTISETRWKYFLGRLTKCSEGQVTHRLFFFILPPRGRFNLTTSLDVWIVPQELLLLLIGPTGSLGIQLRLFGPFLDFGLVRHRRSAKKMMRHCYVWPIRECRGHDRQRPKAAHFKSVYLIWIVKKSDWEAWSDNRLVLLHSHYKSFYIYKSSYY